MRLEVLKDFHYPALLEITRSAESWHEAMTIEQFTANMEKREGYVLVAKDGRLAGGNYRRRFLHCDERSYGRPSAH